MFLTTHAAAGVLISQRFDSPLLVFFISIFAHFVMDFIPHGDENLYQEWDPKKRMRAARVSVIDFLIVVIMIMVLYRTTDLPRFGLVSAGLAGSLLPDLASNFFPLLHKKFREVFIFRSLGFLRKKIFLLHPIMKRQDIWHRWFHRFFDHFLDYRISPVAGIAIQIIIIAIFLITEIR
ncbi:MAG: hypothetical protein PHH01_02490 [Patescibacteria group bacterium]|nr:hypothetical protein [Patescibacteria group bacterium]MDD5567038.1 hypothetical protein [Patescibacteria group bacterium]